MGRSGLGQISDSDARALLLTAARGLLAQDANFTIKTLLARAEVSRSQFRRCFTGKDQLLAAVTGEEVRGLSQILDVAQPEMLRAAVGSDIAPSPAARPEPARADAWLERRLRVFERALSGLEKRQEKTEQTLAQKLALIEERLGALTVAQTVAQKADTPAPEPMETAPQPPADPVCENAAPVLSPAVMAHVEEIAAAEIEPAAQPVTGKDIEDFISHARRAAQKAALVAPVPKQVSWRRRWLAWAAVAVMSVLVSMEFWFIGSAIARGIPMPAATVHREMAPTGIARIIALADNGDPLSQTKLALAYLRGQGVAQDDAAALRWSRAAALQGQPVAQYLLGTLYLDTNQAEAVRWFEAAAAQGNVRAMHNLAIAYAEGTGAPKDPGLAVQWFAHAAGQGYRDSQFDLVVIHERGLGVKQSQDAALTWYLIAAGQGDGPSADRAAFLKGQMASADVRRAEAAAAAFVPLSVTGPANDFPKI